MSVAMPQTSASQELDKEQYRLKVKEAEVILPRLALRPVKSLIISDSEPLDTLDTDLSYVKVVLFSDNTWRYEKDPSYVMSSDVFSENWETASIDPYRLKLDSIPVSWAMWMVDSLSQYCCPFRGNIHPRGKFGIRRGRRHQGVDLPLSTGEPIHSAFEGRVRLSQYSNGYGNLVVIRHPNGIETFYGHLSRRNVKAGDWVSAGDVIGHGGSTGRSTGPHLHFETRYKGFAFDPQWLINFSTGELRHRLFPLKRKYFTPYSNYDQDFEDEMFNEEEDRREAEAAAAMRYYTVRSGDTLSRIAINNHTTVSAICRLNGITANTVLKIGRRLRVK